MELISSVGALIASAVTAVAGHFVAQDIYKGAPRYAKRLLNHAVDILPERDRERYAEEWLAHLYECEGVIGKFRHAIECLLVARKLRRIVEQRTSSEPSSIEFVFSSDGQGTAKVSMDAVTALPLMALIAEALKLKEAFDPKKFVPSEEIVKFISDPRVEKAKFREIQNALKRAKEAGKPGVRILFVDQFGRAMGDDEMEAWFEKEDD